MNDNTSYLYRTLDNGLRIVCEHRPAAAAEYFGIAVMAGSRDEAPDDEYGIAHFVEHTIFKGTAKRKSWHILNRMESVGGELNAYTTKEETYVYSAFPHGNLARAVELIYDLAADSQFPQHQIDLEREVVTDEIASYLDSPAEAIYDDFEDMLFAGCGLGHNILGNEATLKSFTPEKCRNFLERFYVAPNMVAFYSGALPAEKAVEIIGSIFINLRCDSPVRVKEHDILNRCFNKTINLSLHQSHTVLGAITQGIYGNNVATGALFTNIVGGPGMNSLLNLSLRERSGMVYTVEASTALYRDHGMWSVYFGCDSKDTDRCISKIKQTIETLAKTPLKAKTLHQYKKQLSGQMAMARDHHEGSITAIARSTLFHGRALTPEENIARISAVTAEDIQKYAVNLLDLSQLSFE